MSPCKIMVFPGLSLFQSRLESSLLKCSRNSEYPFMALGNVLDLYNCAWQSELPHAIACWGCRA